MTGIGLALDIVGAILLWRFGLPEHISPSGAVHIIGEKPDEAETRKAQGYKRWSVRGIGLLVAGFALQLLGVVLGAWG